MQGTIPLIPRSYRPALSQNPQNAIREAVKNCLTRCYGSDAPLGVLAECLSELRALGWPDDHIRQVESSVRKVLAGVMLDDQGE